MILHLPLMRIIFPANAILFIEIMIPTVGFDVLESYFDWEDQGLFQFDFDRHDKIGDEQFN